MQGGVGCKAGVTVREGVGSKAGGTVQGGSGQRRNGRKTTQGGEMERGSGGGSLQACRGAWIYVRNVNSVALAAAGLYNIT